MINNLEQLLDLIDKKWHEDVKKYIELILQSSKADSIIQGRTQIKYELKRLLE